MKTLEVELGTDKRAAGCRGCGRVFTSVTAFDMHQRFTRQGLVCLDPATLKLERKPNGQWGCKMDERQRARIARFRDGTRQDQACGSSLVSSVGVAC